MGVLLLNENKLDEMNQILEHLMKFVPTIHKQKVVSVPGGSVEIDDTRFSKVLLGGDQLTVAWIEGPRLYVPLMTKQWIDLRVLSQFQKTGMPE